jgi:hypothetical protein
MRSAVLAASVLGAFLSTLGFISNWWTGRFETHYAPTLGVLTKAYGVAAILLWATAGWAAFAPRKK